MLRIKTSIVIFFYLGIQDKAFTEDKDMQIFRLLTLKNVFPHKASSKEKYAKYIFA